MSAFRTCGGVSLDTSNIQAFLDDLFKGNGAAEAEEPKDTSNPIPHVKDTGARRSAQPRTITSAASSKAWPESMAAAGGRAFMTSPSSNELVRLSDDSEEDLAEDLASEEQRPDSKAEKWKRKVTPPRGVRCKRSGPQVVSSGASTTSSTTSSTVVECYPRTLYFRGNATPEGECKIEVQSTELSGSPTSEFRDAHVTFSENQVMVDLVDKKGRTWRLLSTMLNGVNTSESRFNLDATGKEMKITLKKAETTDSWEEHIFLKPQVRDQNGFHVDERALEVYEADKAAGVSHAPEPIKPTSSSAPSEKVSQKPSALGCNFLLM